MMNARDRAVARIEHASYAFVLGVIDRWQYYGVVWADVDARRISLADARTIAVRAGAVSHPGVFDMRRRDYCEWRRTKEGDR